MIPSLILKQQAGLTPIPIYYLVFRINSDY